MKKIIIYIILGTLAFLFGYLGYLDRVKSFIGGFENSDWGIIFQVFIFLVLPSLVTILVILWLVGILFKIEKKLDE